MEMLLKLSGTGRDKDNDKALQFYFNRPVTDDELRFLHGIVQLTLVELALRTRNNLQ